MIKSFEEMPVGIMQQIMDINGTRLSDDEKTFRVAALINGISYDEILSKSLTGARELVAAMQWVYDVPKPGKVKKTYTLNGKTYVLQAKMENMTTAQYIDFQSVWREDYLPVIADLLSVCLIPKGHKYNDGYEHSEVVEDITNYLPVTEALAIANFFTRRFVRSTKRLFRRANLLMTIAKVTATKEQKERIAAIQLQAKLIQEEFLKNFKKTR